VAKVNVSLPGALLEKLDEAARETHTSRSAFLAEAVERYLKEMEEEKLKEQRRRAAVDIDRIREEFGPWDGTAEILKWRDRH